VLDKPAGIAVHGGSGVSFGVIEALRALHPDDSLELVHRLDRGTSGLMVVAKHDKAHEELSRQFHDREVEKEYFALVWG
jgi:23S rRNA pseudouridine955/2504/2580 synthase